MSDPAAKWRAKQARQDPVSVFDEWIEVEETFLKDTKLGTDDPPTEAWLFTWICTRQKRGIRRQRHLHTIRCNGNDDMAEKIAAYVDQPNVFLIEDTNSGT